jgi:hypothetical protein
MEVLLRDISLMRKSWKLFPCGTDLAKKKIKVLLKGKSLAIKI